MIWNWDRRGDQDNHKVPITIEELPLQLLNYNKKLNKIINWLNKQTVQYRRRPKIVKQVVLSLRNLIINNLVH